MMNGILSQSVSQSVTYVGKENREDRRNTSEGRDRRDSKVSKEMRDLKQGDKESTDIYQANFTVTCEDWLLQFLQ